MFKVQLSLLTLTSLIKFITAQNTIPGSCHNFDGIGTLNTTAMNGNWFEYARTPRADEDGAKCIQFSFGEVFLNQWTITRYQNRLISTKTIRKATIQSDGKLGTWDGTKATFLNFDVDDNMVIYGCKQVLLGKNEIFWILTREQEPSQDTVLKALSVIQSYDLSMDQLHVTVQTKCPDYNNDIVIST